MAKSRDDAKRMLMAEAPKVPENIIEMLLDVHEHNPAYFQDQMRVILREEKKGIKLEPVAKLACTLPSITVENLGVTIEEIQASA